MGSTPIRDLGPCCIVWDPDGDNIELKPCFGTVTFRGEDSAADIFENQHGEAPVDAVFTGRLITLEAPMTRSNLVQLEAVIHDATKHKHLGKYKILKVPNVVGDNMFPLAKEIILKPVLDRVCSATTSEWLHVFRCYPMAAFEIGYDNSGQRVYNVSFKVFPDDSSGNVGYLWRMGPAS